MSTCGACAPRSTRDLRGRSSTRAAARAICCRRKPRSAVFNSFRLQLTAWYVLFFVLLLGGFSGFLYFLLAKNLESRVNISLTSGVETVSTLLAAELQELGGDSRAAAKEIVEELRLPFAYVAIYEDGRLLDCAAPLRKITLPLTTGDFTIPFGAHGARMTMRPYQWK